MKKTIDDATSTEWCEADKANRAASVEVAAIARAEKAEAERDALAADKARLDWLERNVQEVGFERMNERVLGGISFDRAAIDAAMKEDSP